ncbi:SDR family oxidoreductase [Methylophaga sp. OBS4]|uniref:SDR family oxidoreductase n=1 Tax=Methylophaga sp. OBS4 TaxID=2991935 RepID=UPI002254A172|nr:SDR family oxidoreductase [Methylophaga sp. OBS4]MCX4188020.1 SDR family oxidoreductase [Methylophaga sp. OBS4]
MDKTLVIGAHGQIGKLLIKLMTQQHLPVKAMVRRPEQKAEMEKLGAEAVIGDLEQDLPDEAFADCDKVVFTAGSGGKTGADKTILVDLWGACKAVDKAKQHHIKQFVMVSSRDAGDPEQGTPAIKHYNICKHFADKHLLESGLHYTILRPGRLTDEPATGLITTKRPTNKDEQIISRSDVAACIVQCLDHSEAINQLDEIYQGDIPIKEAFIRAIKGRLG